MFEKDKVAGRVLGMRGPVALCLGVLVGIKAAV